MEHSEGHTVVLLYGNLPLLNNKSDVNKFSGLMTVPNLSELLHLLDFQGDLDPDIAEG